MVALCSMRAVYVQAMAKRIPLRFLYACVAFEEPPVIRYQLAHDLTILFVGINPHPGSDARGVPFSNNKMFWYLLSDAGLITESRHELRDDDVLKKMYTRRFAKEYRLGLINLIDRPTRTTAKLKKADADPGRTRLLRVIQRYKPRVVCFVGKLTYSLFAQTMTCSYGWQQSIGISKIYVMHTPLRGPITVRVQELREQYCAAQQVTR